MRPSTLSSPLPAVYHSFIQAFPKLLPQVIIPPDSELPWAGGLLLS